MHSIRCALVPLPLPQNVCPPAVPKAARPPGGGRGGGGGPLRRPAGRGAGALRRRRRPAAGAGVAPPRMVAVLPRGPTPWGHGWVENGRVVGAGPPSPQSSFPPFLGVILGLWLGCYQGSVFGKRADYPNRCTPLHGHPTADFFFDSVSVTCSAGGVSLGCFLNSGTFPNSQTFFSQICKKP